MQQNSTTQKIIIGSSIAFFILASIGLLFMFSKDGSLQDDTSVVDVSLLNGELKAYYAAKDKINFKDLSFTKKLFYSQLRDDTVEIPSIKPTGRPNPFVP